MQRRSFLRGASTLAATAALPVGRAMAQSADLAGRDPKTLVDATVGNLDPATNVAWAYGLRPVYETLTQLDGSDTRTVAPSLATAWQSNPDGSSWTFALAAGATFHDGTPCDAAAVKAAVTRLMTRPTGQGSTWQITDPAVQITVVDAATIRFDLGTPRPFFDRQVSSQYGFWIASPTAAEGHSTGSDDMGPDVIGLRKSAIASRGQRPLCAAAPMFWPPSTPANRPQPRMTSGVAVGTGPILTWWSRKPSRCPPAVGSYWNAVGPTSP